MATRPIYIPETKDNFFVRTIFVDFEWHAGMSASQKKKSISSLQKKAIEIGICNSPLEISSKSEHSLGVSLSAFNLKVETVKQKRVFTVETAYQSSKVFSNGGPYIDLLDSTSRLAKTDPRLKNSGNLKEFKFFGEIWPLEPKTAFYDWLYINALHKNQWAVEQLSSFDSFTDIEFNPKKSINCQAYSVALYKSLANRGLILDAIKSREAYMNIISSVSINNACENTEIQPNLI
jgi:hypothetical protein